MIEYYQSTKVIVFAHNPKVKIRGWIHLGRMIRKVVNFLLYTMYSALVCCDITVEYMLVLPKSIVFEHFNGLFFLFLHMLMVSFHSIKHIYLSFEICVLNMIEL